MPRSTNERDKAWRAWALGSAMVLCIAMGACGTPTDEDTRSATAGLPDDRQALASESWVLEPSETEPSIDTSRAITVEVEGDDLVGQGPCNPYQATFSTSDGSIDIAAPATTLASCGASDDSAEAAYFAALTEVTDIDTTDRNRTELSGNGIRLVFVSVQQR